MTLDEPAEPARAAGVVARSPQGRVLMVRRVDDGTWSWPGGVIKNGETADQAAMREFFEETGRRLGDVGQVLMRLDGQPGWGLSRWFTVPTFSG